MRIRLIGSALLLTAFVTMPAVGDVVFEEEFVNGQPAVNQCVAWQAFQAELTEQDYTSVTVSGSNDPDGVVCDDPDVVKQIAEALRTNGVFTGDCNGNNWRVGACGNVSRELSTAGTTCLCSNPASIVRPCLTNANWGGIAGPTCSAPSQTMKVVFATGSSTSCNYITKKYKQRKCADSGCPTQRVDDCSYDSDEGCESIGDCAKKVKLKSGCVDPDEKGKCKHVLSRCDCK